MQVKNFQKLVLLKAVSFHSKTRGRKTNCGKNASVFGAKRGEGSTKQQQKRRVEEGGGERH